MNWIRKIFNFSGKKFKEVTKNDSQISTQFRILNPDQLDTLTRWQYRVAYRKAADHLAIKALDASVNEQLRLGMIYPIMFLYRQCIELTIKDLLVKAHTAGVRTSVPKSGHNLSILWNELLKDLAAIKGADDASEIDDIFGEFVRELQTLDPGGDAFRYSTDRNAEPHRSKPVTIDVLVIKLIVKSFEAQCRLIDEDIESYRKSPESPA